MRLERWLKRLGVVTVVEEISEEPDKFCRMEGDIKKVSDSLLFRMAIVT